MPDIADRIYPRHYGPRSASPACAPGAEGTPSLPARLARAFALICEAFRSRIAEIVDAEISYEESTVPYVQCDHCGDVHPKTVRCEARAIGFCVNEGRRRLLDGQVCSKCGSRSVTDIHFRWSIQGGLK